MEEEEDEVAPVPLALAPPAPPSSTASAHEGSAVPPPLDEKPADHRKRATAPPKTAKRRIIGGVQRSAPAPPAPVTPAPPAPTTPSPEARDLERRSRGGQRGDTPTSRPSTREATRTNSPPPASRRSNRQRSSGSVGKSSKSSTGTRGNASSWMPLQSELFFSQQQVIPKKGPSLLRGGSMSAADLHAAGPLRGLSAMALDLGEDVMALAPTTRQCHDPPPRSSSSSSRLRVSKSTPSLSSLPAIAGRKGFLVGDPGLFSVHKITHRVEAQAMFNYF